jgi:peptidoglycan-N-acetylmuramic acid deacetylase
VLKFAAGGAAIFFAGQPGSAVGRFGSGHQAPGANGITWGLPDRGPLDAAPAAAPRTRVVVPGLSNSGIAPPPPPPPPPVAIDARYAAPAMFQHGDPAVKVVYLTMDDCYSTASVASAMEVAERYGAKLTFFPYAQVMSKSPDLWKQVRGRGHGVENHTYSHKSLPGLSDSALYDEMEGWNRVARDVLGKEYAQAFFRPPGGAGVLGTRDERIFKVAAELGMKIAMWSADSQSWKYKDATDPISAGAVASNALANFGAGSIVLQHALACDVLALPSILEQAKRQGLACKTLRKGIR